MPSFLVKCRSCGVSNRIPAEKEGVAGHCGHCKATLPALYWRPQLLTDNSFDAFIAGYDGLVLAEFWAPWCPHCLSFAPAVRKAAEILAGSAAVGQINTEENPRLAARFAVSGIPVIQLLRKGKVLDQLAGAQPAEAIVSWFWRKAGG